MDEQSFGGYLDKTRFYSLLPRIYSNIIKLVERYSGYNIC